MSRFIFKFIKKLISFFPPTFPYKIYNIFTKIPILKYFLSKIIQKITPDYIDIEEGRVMFDKTDPVMSGGISLGEYEPEMVKFFRSRLKEGMTVVDIGANLGYFTVIVASRVGPLGKVFSYEPDSHNFNLLEKNIIINGFRNVKAIPIALSDHIGTRKLYFGDNQCTISFSDRKGTDRFEIVATDTLDNSLKSLGFPKIDIIKMDIEGAEPIVFEGMRETIIKNSNIIILFEFYPNAIRRLNCSPLEFLEKFKSIGFSFSVIDEDYKNHISINDLKDFIANFPKKDFSVNLIAMKV